MAQENNDVQQQGDLTPDQQESIKRITLAAQAMIADERYSKQIVDMASSGDDGIVNAASLILDAIGKKGKRIGQDWAIPAATAILTVLMDFLTSIGVAQTDTNHFTKLLGVLISRVAKEYKIKPELVGQMVGGAPSGMRKQMNAQAARGGMIGKLMQRGGVNGPAQ